MTEQIFGPSNFVITSLHFYGSARFACGVFFPLNTRDVFHKILCDFSGPGVMQQQPSWGGGVMPLNT